MGNRNHGRLLKKITAAGLACVLFAAGLLRPAAAAEESCKGWNTAKFFESATVEQVKACLKAGRDPNEQDPKGLTALHWAARKTSDPVVIEVLLDAGANPRASSIAGRTPWDYARRNKKIKGSTVSQRLRMSLASEVNKVAKKADWSRVQVVPHNAKTEVTLYQDAAPQENRRIRGRFDSATTDAITLWLKDGQTRTFPKSDVRKVRIPRPFSKRWPGWITLAGSVLAAELFRLWVQDLPASYAALNLGIAAGATAVVFVNSEMGTIYKVPPGYRSLPQADRQSGDQDNTSGKAGRSARN